MRPDLVEHVEAYLARELGDGWRVLEELQELWSGYGAILRCVRDGESPTSAIVKCVWPDGKRGRHPRAWGTERGHARKLESYRVEHRFYESYAPVCDSPCRVPLARALSSQSGAWIFVLEDLDAAGYSERRASASEEEIRSCLAWMASFHARFLGDDPAGLWPTGCYWHLATRPEELAAMRDGALRDAAHEIDARLENARFKTIVHGDAKLANFCFRPAGARAQASVVAAVDFQYAGGGCGVKDLAYFLSSCLGERELEAHASGLVDEYFILLDRALAAEGREDEVVDAICAEWRELYPFAWADFLRFLAGWAPTHAKVHAYSRRMTQEVLASLRSP